MTKIPPIVLFLIMLAVGLVQLRLGYLGIEYHLGTLAAVVLSLAAFLGVLLPVTIGSYFGAVDVMGWPIWVGLLVSVPGVFFATPMLMLRIVQSATKSAMPTVVSPATDGRQSFGASELHFSQAEVAQQQTATDWSEREHRADNHEITPYRNDEIVNKEFEELAAYSSRLSEIDHQLGEVPEQFKAEFRRRVLMSSRPLVDAAAIAEEVLEKHHAVLNPFDRKEANSYYKHCLDLLGEPAARKFLEIMHRLGETADPREVYLVIEQEVQEKRKADAADIEKLKKREIVAAAILICLIALLVVVIGFGT